MVVLLVGRRISRMAILKMHIITATPFRRCVYWFVVGRRSLIVVHVLVTKRIRVVIGILRGF